jgi:hypothetical protein
MEKLSTRIHLQRGALTIARHGPPASGPTPTAAAAGSAPPHQTQTQEATPPRPAGTGELRHRTATALPARPALLGSLMGCLAAARLALGRTVVAPTLSRAADAGTWLRERGRACLPRGRPPSLEEDADGPGLPALNSVADLKRLIRDLDQGSGEDLRPQDKALALGRLARVASTPRWIRDPDERSNLPRAITLLVVEIEQACVGFRGNKDPFKVALLTLAAALPGRQTDRDIAAAIARCLLHSLQKFKVHDEAQALRDRWDFLMMLAGMPCFQSDPALTYLADQRSHTEAMAERVWDLVQAQLDAPLTRAHSQPDAKGLPSTGEPGAAPLLVAMAQTRSHQLTVEVQRALRRINRPDTPLLEQIHNLDAIRQHLAQRIDLPGGTFLEGIASPREVAKLLARIQGREAKTQEARHLLSQQITHLPRLCQLRCSPALIEGADRALARIWKQARPVEDAAGLAQTMSLADYQQQVRKNAALRLVSQRALAALGDQRRLDLPWLTS